MHDRVRLAKEGMEIPEDAIVFSDEMWVEFNSTRRMRNQSRKRGSNPYLQAEPKDRNDGTIRVMAWAAIAKGFKSKLFIYDPEDMLSSGEQQVAIREANRILKERTERKQAAAHVPGTDEHKIFQEFNANITRQNKELGLVGNRKKRQRKPEQLFKERPVPETITKGGVNWSAYRQKVCEDVLYPWIAEIKASTGHSIIYLVEDNAPSHQTVRRVDFDRRAELGIKALDWPSNSPDLNKIERCWDPMKDEISIFHFIGASQETVAEAKVCSSVSYLQTTRTVLKILEYTPPHLG